MVDPSRTATAALWFLVRSDIKIGGNKPRYRWVALPDFNERPDFSGLLAWAMAQGLEPDEPFTRRRPPHWMGEKPKGASRIGREPDAMSRSPGR